MKPANSWAEGTKLLNQIPDDDLRLFATIELAAALAGLPAASITQMKQPRPRHTSMAHGGGMAEAGSPDQMGSDRRDGPTMRSPDGRLIRCPSCLLSPRAAFSGIANSVICGTRFLLRESVPHTISNGKLPGVRTVAKHLNIRPGTSLSRSRAEKERIPVRPFMTRLSSLVRGLWVMSEPEVG